MKKYTFEVIDTSLNKEYGEIIFEKNKISFKLKQSVDPELWNKVGFIPLSNDRRSTFGEFINYAIDSRLPLKLRASSVDEKISYIKSNGLKVASDSYNLVPFTGN